ncbi:phage tail domain-containing protein [Paenibacillus sp. UMB4589-SE434]|uniref:phage distal tail protein n=1 Tax=Paenibacillus sp. UMB4589-SE434 TaxID=3046314 RepID=UPI00254E4C61|nr:phage tail domain-containing protein [Paenibacillus sp. UMB4589-SE434]MDK8182123.1 phage tail family protein [Paenibacillus sp. UMB4589-SE434]
MFNLTPFNLAPFNRIRYIETFLTVTIDTVTDATARLNVDIPVSVIIDSATESQFALTREITLITQPLETATELITRLLRERLMSVTADTATEFSIDVTYSHVDEIKFTGDFKPGDRLVIDTKKMTVTLNGQNVLHLFDGDFFNLVLGTNKLMYTDGESARNILTRITHRDKFLY